MIALAILVAVVVFCVALHRFAVNSVFRSLRRQTEAGIKPHVHVTSVLMLLTAHIIEVVAFALGALAIMALGDATIDGQTMASLHDAVYFSFNVYSSLGFGDVVPTGELRLYSGVEVIVGLLMIAWSAAALFSEAFFQ